MRLKPIFIFNCKRVYEQQPVTTQLKNTICRAEFINLYNIFVMYLNNKYKYSHPGYMSAYIPNMDTLYLDCNKNKTIMTMAF